MSEWISFVYVGTSPSGKTKLWNVSSNDQSSILGQVKWWGGWRKYAFFPSPSTLYEQDCLRAIAKFCEEQTSIHRTKNHEPVQTT